MNSRRVTILIGLLVVGFVINGAVTIACVMWSRPDTRLPRDAGKAAQQRMIDLWTVHRPDEAPLIWPGGTITVQRGLGVSLLVASNGHKTDRHSLFWFRTGWPLATVEGGRWRHMKLEPDPTIKDAMMIAPGSGGYERQTFILHPYDVPLLGLSRPRIVPTGLAWTGIVVNTLFYALMAGLLLALIAAARRRWRLSRGRCPHCSYPIGASPTCTECGADLPRPAPA